MGKQPTTEEFINMIAGDFPDLDLSKVVYTKQADVVPVFCLKHELPADVKLHDLNRRRNPCPLCGGRNMTTEQFVLASQKIHNNKFDYSKTVLVKRTAKVTITCPEHGDFEQLAIGHLEGRNGCGDCSGQKRITRDGFIERSEKEHGKGAYDYSKVSNEFPQAIHTKVELQCLRHGEWFIQSANSHLKGKRGCNKCYLAKRTLQDVIERADLMFPDKKFDYSKLDLSKKGTEKVLIGCTIDDHGFFEQTLNGHWTGKEGCPICDRKNRLTSTEDFVRRVKEIHGDTYDYGHLNLVNGQRDDIELTCQSHGAFTISPWYHLQGYACPRCVKWGQSAGEEALAEFIEGLGFEIVRRDRKILRGKEIDVFVPSLNIGFEFNGVYWHTEKYVGKDLHRIKADRAEEAGIRLVQIWEDDWFNRSAQVLSHVRHVLGKNDEGRVFARKCSVREITTTDALDFLNAYHIQGFVSSSHYVGLFHDNVLVAVGSFLKSGEDFVLSRYATSVPVVGGHGKLVSFFERGHEFRNLITFADRCFSDGGLYEKTGWVRDSMLKPDYSYLVGLERKHKFGYRLKRFREDPDLLFREGLSERELADLNGLERIWDAGKIRYIR